MNLEFIGYKCDTSVWRIIFHCHARLLPKDMLRQIRAQGGWVFKLESDSYVDLNILGTSWNLRVISKIYLTILFDLSCMYSYEAGGQEAAVNQAWTRWPLHLPPKRPRCLVIALWQTYKIFQMVYLSCSIPQPNHSCQPPWIDSRSTRGCSVARGKTKSGHDETTLTQTQFISPCYLIVLIILYHHHSLSSSFLIIIILYHHHSLSSSFFIIIILCHHSLSYLSSSSPSSPSSSSSSPSSSSSSSS